MSLAGRLSTFFLGALAVVLAGFSISLHYLARYHLDRQVDERLSAALATLSASTELEENMVEWEPVARSVSLGIDKAADQVRWAIHDDRGNLIGRSPNLASNELLAALRPPVHRYRTLPRRIEVGGHEWRAASRLVRSERPGVPAPGASPP